MNFNIKNEKGITMIAVVITIVILLIIISTVSFSSKNGIDMKKLNNMYSDILILEEKVAIYYLKNDALPIGRVVDNSIFQPVTEMGVVRIHDILNEELYPNNKKEGSLNPVFYEIDLNKLENVSLNNMNTTNEKDKYIINAESHIIYYIKGVTVEEYNAGTEGKKTKTYYTIPRDYTKIDLENMITNVVDQIP